ncbi:MAG TPA: DUF2867 domain-containing protein [Solirubrobacterales bacterium]|nr:DUF2867 domain-containing protein [Solirubrobacterales bacterium]
MRIPNSTHESGPWEIRAIVPDFTLEDAWALPVRGGPDDFERLIELACSGDPAQAESLPTRFLWGLRDRLGAWFDLGRISAPAADDSAGGLAIPGEGGASVSDRLPGHLRGTAADVHFESLPFVPLYRTDTEFAAEISNPTVHGVMHLAWAELEEDRFQAQMAVYVKPRGLFGKGYMALIKPFRYLIVYPALTRQIEREWAASRAAA